MTGPGVRGGLVAFVVDGPTGDDAPGTPPGELARGLRESGHAVAPGTWWCLPWCRCRNLPETLAFSAGSKKEHHDV